MLQNRKKKKTAEHMFFDLALCIHFDFVKFYSIEWLASAALLVVDTAVILGYII